MSFEYFNTSHLAFGSKLTRAFRQLEKEFNDAQNNINGYIRDVEYLGDFINRNYRMPLPNSATSAVRANEIFDVINDNTYVKDINYTNGTLRASFNFFNRNTNRMTIASGSTSLKEGYAYYKNSISNINPASTINFSEVEDDSLGNLLFQYRIDDNDNVNIVNNVNSVYNPMVGNLDYINNIELGDNISLPFTATDNCCVLVIGNYVSDGNSINVSVNNKEIFRSYGANHKNSCFVYLSKGDVLKGINYNSARLINYNAKEDWE